MSCAGCGKAASETTTRLLRCNACKSVEYCDRDCQVSHWREHKPVCKDIVARITLELRTRGARLPSGARLPKVLSDAATSIQAAAHAGDLLAVKQLVAAGANVEEVDAQGGGTALYAAAAGGQIEVVKYLAEDCGANLSHLDKWEASMFHTAGVGGYLEVSGRAPALRQRPAHPLFPPPRLSPRSFATSTRRFPSSSTWPTALARLR